MTGDGNAARDARAVVDERHDLHAGRDETLAGERGEDLGIDRLTELHRLDLLDRVEIVLAVGGDGMKSDLHAAHVAPIGNVDVGRPVAVDIFRAQRQAALRVDPQRLGLTAVGFDFNLPRAPAADRAEPGKMHVIRRVNEGIRIDEFVGARAPFQQAGELLDVAVAVAFPHAIADAQRRVGPRTETLVVALAVAGAPGVKCARQSFAGERADGLDRVDVGGMHRAVVGGEDRRDRRRRFIGPRTGAGRARECDQPGSEGAAPTARGTVRANRGRSSRSFGFPHRAEPRHIFRPHRGPRCRRRRPDAYRR